MDVDSEDDCSWSDAGGILHAPEGPQPATPTEGHALTTVPEQAVHGPEEPQPAMPTGSHALIPVPEQVAHPSASKGLGDTLDTAPDTEHITEPVSGFMIAMANLEPRTVPVTRSASVHINAIPATMPARIVSFEEDNS